MHYKMTKVNWLTCPPRILHPQQVFHQRVCQSVVHVVASCQVACRLVDEPPPDLPAAGIQADPAAPVGGLLSLCLQNRQLFNARWNQKVWQKKKWMRWGKSLELSLNLNHIQFNSINVLKKYKNGHYSNRVTHFISVTLKDEIQHLPPITFIKKVYQKS